MKKISLFTGMALVLLCLSGCLSTLYPFFTEKDVVYEPSLPGFWSEKGNTDGILFEKATANDFKELPALQQMADKAYMVTMKEEKDESRFFGFLTKLGKNTYLDLYPTETTRQQLYDHFFKDQYTPLHTLYRLQLKTGNTFEIGQLKEDFLRDLINKKQIRIQHEQNPVSDYIITAPTSALQQYVLKYGDDPDAYETGSIFYKKLNY